MGRPLGPPLLAGALTLAKAQADIAKLQAALGHIFADQKLLEHALTHVSSVKSGNIRLQSYQRLEFLGDRVLGLAIAEMLSATFPDADEGELARRMAELVRKETCAEVAADWNTGPNIRLGAGEAQSGGRKRLTILADVCEAVIGAVFLDAGYDAAKTVIGKAWSRRLTQEEGGRRDPKTLLQEMAQARRLGMPSYREVSRSGPAHRMHFLMAVDVEVLGSAEGSGGSKREAEQAAARALLDRITGEGAAP
ncbi:MAG: ribonuclease III [Beijerinckiaceae bacterium]